MKLDQLKEQIKRQCTELEAGGFRPTNEIEESWLGRVSLFLPEEELPIDKNGNQMAPLGQFCHPSMPFVPEALLNIHVLTVFMSPDLEGDSDLMEGFWEMREYRSADNLVRKDFEGGNGWLKPFPLKASLIKADYPVWDGGGLTSDEEDAFLKLENDGDISDYPLIVMVINSGGIHRFANPA